MSIQRYSYEDIERAFVYREHEAVFVEYSDHIAALAEAEQRVREYLLTHNRSETLEWLEEDK